MPDHEAARLTDPHTCPSAEPGPVLHLGGPIQSGSGKVFIEDLNAARAKVDYAQCKAGGPDFIAQGSGTVLIDDMPAARTECKTQHDGVILGKSPTVMIGGPTLTVLAIFKRTAGGAAPVPPSPSKVTKVAKPQEKSKSKEDEKEGKGPDDPQLPCSIVDFEVSCSHDPMRKRRATGGMLQVVGEGSVVQRDTKWTPPDSGGFGSWIEFQVASEVTEGGKEKIAVRINRNQSKCEAKHALAFTSSPSSDSAVDWVTGDSAEFEMGWAGPEPDWPSSQPLVRYVHVKGCNEGEVRTSRVEMFQPTQLKITLSAAVSEGESDTVSSLKQEFFSRALNYFRAETKLKASGSVSLAHGYKEAPDDARVLFECRGTGSVDVSFNVRGYANLIAIASLLVAAPLALISRFLKYGIEVEFFLGATITVAGSQEFAVSRYIGGGFGGGITPDAKSANLSIEVGLKLQVGFEWVQAIRVEAGSKVDFIGNYSWEINDRGIYNSLNLRRGPVMLFVVVAAEGWFVNLENTYQVEVFPGSETVIGYSNKAVYLFR